MNLRLKLRGLLLCAVWGVSCTLSHNPDLPSNGGDGDGDAVGDGDINIGDGDGDNVGAGGSHPGGGTSLGGSGPTALAGAGGQP